MVEIAVPQRHLARELVDVFLPGARLLLAQRLGCRDGYAQRGKGKEGEGADKGIEHVASSREGPILFGARPCYIVNAINRRFRRLAGIYCPARCFWTALYIGPLISQSR